MQCREAANQNPENLLKISLGRVEEFLGDEDIRCIFLAARALHDFTKNDRLLMILIKQLDFWKKVLCALDKCNNDLVAKDRV